MPAKKKFPRFLYFRATDEMRTKLERLGQGQLSSATLVRICVEHVLGLPEKEVSRLITKRTVLKPVLAEEKSVSRG